MDEEGSDTENDDMTLETRSDELSQIVAENRQVTSKSTTKPPATTKSPPKPPPCQPCNLIHCVRFILKKITFLLLQI